MPTEPLNPMLAPQVFKFDTNYVGLDALQPFAPLVRQALWLSGGSSQVRQRFVELHVIDRFEDSRMQRPAGDWEQLVVVPSAVGVNSAVYLCRDDDADTLICFIVRQFHGVVVFSGCGSADA